MDDKYDDWLEAATKAVSQYQLQGYMVHPVLIDISELMIWCHIQARPLDRAARAEYAIWKFQQQSSHN